MVELSKSNLDIGEAGNVVFAFRLREEPKLSK